MATRRTAPRAVSVYALAGIRLLDPDREPSGPAAVYAFRLFGIRTILLGLDPLTNRDERLRKDLRDGVPIHDSDTATRPRWASAADFHRVPRCRSRSSQPPPTANWPSRTSSC
ncbi:hypothetical protein SAMN04487983_10777 [Streptomyces sp. yr375]|nr:hypothetical protein SAMN04487983_10777 [Streptomyces sp. yr375]